MFFFMTWNNLYELRASGVCILYISGYTRWCTYVNRCAYVRIFRDLIYRVLFRVT
jgi:hypothetical protein